MARSSDRFLAAGRLIASGARLRCSGSAFCILSARWGRGWRQMFYVHHRSRYRRAGHGISTVVAPMYISEIAPAKFRGRLAGMFQFNIVFGILIAFVSNALLAGIGANAWRWMLGVAAFPVAAVCGVLLRPS